MNDNSNYKADIITAPLSSVLSSTTANLERSRCLETEIDASLFFASSILYNPDGLLSSKSVAKAAGDPSAAITNFTPKDQILPGGLKDAWSEMSAAASGKDEQKVSSYGSNILPANANAIGIIANNNNDMESSVSTVFEAPLGKGQLSKAVTSTTLAVVLQRANTVAIQLIDQDDGVIEQTKASIDALEEVLGNAANAGGNTLDLYLKLFYERIGEVREYHAKSGDSTPGALNATVRKRKYANPEADGYDLSSIVASETVKVRDGRMFSAEEVLGKYIDLNDVHEKHVLGSLRMIFQPYRAKVQSRSSEEVENSTGAGFLSYIDFLTILGEGLPTAIAEKCKLSERKKYIRFLNDLRKYLEGFVRRTTPLMNFEKEIVEPTLAEFDDEWNKKGCVKGWSVEKHNSGSSTQQSDLKSPPIDLGRFSSAADLEHALGGDGLKIELMKLGMKCGGAPKDRAKRLFSAKSTPLHSLPRKFFVGNKAPEPKQETNRSSATSLMGESRIDIARLEALVIAILNHLRPIFDATIRRAERRLTQTSQERETEVEEEINGALAEIKEEKGKGEEGDDDSDEEDAPIYNPKGVPLGFDGKPIPYWLFKLHGLNHFFSCEICGNETYRGRMNFEKHFTEQKHAYGMRCLGIPNTKHFHGVTQIEDAQKLWASLQDKLTEEQFDRSKDEEYEDSHGNILSLATYEDLARQGLL